MSKYTPLWEYIQKNSGSSNIITFAEVKDVLGFEIDHSFLNFKKDLINYGFEVVKISMKEKTIKYKKLQLVAAHTLIDFGWESEMSESAYKRVKQIRTAMI